MHVMTKYLDTPQSRDLRTRRLPTDGTGRRPRHQRRSRPATRGPDQSYEREDYGCSARERSACR
ncbi:hypothetical protein FRC0043_02505 [Corynebacterium belfantii]|nr:hypothetical protein FRC0043_02505 [Corynebacterium belfantii]